MIQVTLTEFEARDLVDLLDGNRLFEPLRSSTLDGLRTAAQQRAAIKAREEQVEKERALLTVKVARSGKTRWRVEVFSGGAPWEEFILDGFHARQLVWSVKHAAKRKEKPTLDTNDRRSVKAFLTRGLTYPHGPGYGELTVRAEKIVEALVRVTGVPIEDW